jgi:hypothetical protein
MRRHYNASREKASAANKKGAKTHLNASHPYVPLPVFVGRNWSRGPQLLPSLAVFCRKLLTYADIQQKCRLVP